MFLRKTSALGLRPPQLARMLLVFVKMALRTRIEERFLLERFGDQYRSYMGRVGRFFPGLGIRQSQ